MQAGSFSGFCAKKKSAKSLTYMCTSRLALNNLLVLGLHDEKLRARVYPKTFWSYESLYCTGEDAEGAGVIGRKLRYSSWSAGPHWQ